jgi:catechol 2,3-dioxygenase-like lactoylglutathione lyase family enzyme
MALNGLLDIELSVPDPTPLAEFWLRRGMVRTDDGVLGTVDRPVQLRLAEGTHRHLSSLHLSCEHERDLADIAARIGALGVASTVVDTRLTCTDPVFGHEVIIDVTAPHPVAPAPERAFNHAGRPGRVGERADAASIDATPRPPRRLGHFVLGTPHVAEATAFFFDGLGFKVSDQILGGIATFGRIETDHHTFLVQPGATSYLNHYALEMDDIDAIGAAGQAVLAERADANVVGVGRHFLGSNVFWYLTDPAGNMFEFFSDIDQIVDDEAWERDHLRRDWGGADGPAPVSVWGPKEPEAFFNPPDIAQIAAAREAMGLR